MSADKTNEIMKMLRAVINGQSVLKQELLAADKKTREELIKEIMKNRKRINEVEKSLTVRLNMQGKQLAELDDDSPTGQEFRKLEKRVTKVERRLASV